MKNISYKYLIKISRKNIPQKYLAKHLSIISQISQKNISFRGISEFGGKSGIIEF